MFFIKSENVKHEGVLGKSFGAKKRSSKKKPIAPKIKKVVFKKRKAYKSCKETNRNDVGKKEKERYGQKAKGF